MLSNKNFQCQCLTVALFKQCLIIIFDSQTVYDLDMVPCKWHAVLHPGSFDSYRILQVRKAFTWIVQSFIYTNKLFFRAYNLIKNKIARSFTMFIDVSIININQYFPTHPCDVTRSIWRHELIIQTQPQRKKSNSTDVWRNID